MTKTNKEQKADFMVWQLELQVSLMKGTLELYRGREEYTREDKEKLEYGPEWKVKLAEEYAFKNHADYIEETIKELEGILAQYKAEDEDEDEELFPLSDEDILEWKYGNDYDKFVK
jgi:hypothetical protein